MIVFLQDKNVSFIVLASDWGAIDFTIVYFQSRAIAVGLLNFGAGRTCNLQKAHGQLNKYSLYHILTTCLFSP